MGMGMGMGEGRKGNLEGRQRPSTWHQSRSYLVLLTRFSQPDSRGSKESDPLLFRDEEHEGTRRMPCTSFGLWRS